MRTALIFIFVGIFFLSCSNNRFPVRAIKVSKNHNTEFSCTEGHRSNPLYISYGVISIKP